MDIDIKDGRYIETGVDMMVVHGPESTLRIWDLGGNHVKIGIFRDPGTRARLCISCDAF